MMTTSSSIPALRSKPITAAFTTREKCFLVFWLATIFYVLVAAAPSQGQAVRVLQYHAGPVLNNFTIYPLYYGSGWGSGEIPAEQAYLQKVAGYISGNNNPSGQLPTLRQYGSKQAHVKGAHRMNSTDAPHSVTMNELLNIIHTAQKKGLLPKYASNRLIMVLLGHGFTTTGVCTSAPNDLHGCHNAENSSSIWSMIPADSCCTFAEVTAHEVLEAASDPQPFTGWDEAADGCDHFMVNGIFIPTIHDDTINGACSGFINALPAPVDCGFLWGVNQSLVSGTAQNTWASCDGRFSLTLQNDGNLVLSQAGVGPIWASNTSGSTAITYSAIMQVDGNFVLYRGMGGASQNSIWATNTWGNNGAFLLIQNDGNLVVYDNSGTVPLWASNTCCR